VWVLPALSLSCRCTYVYQYENRALLRRTSPVIAVVHIPLAQRTQPKQTTTPDVSYKLSNTKNHTTATMKYSGLQRVPRIRCKHVTGERHKQAQAADVSDAARTAAGASVSGRGDAGWGSNSVRRKQRMPVHAEFKVGTSPQFPL